MLACLHACEGEERERFLSLALTGHSGFRTCSATWLRVRACPPSAFRAPPLPQPRDPPGCVAIESAKVRDSGSASFRHGNRLSPRWLFPTLICVICPSSFALFVSVARGRSPKFASPFTSPFLYSSLLWFCDIDSYFPYCIFWP